MDRDQPKSNARALSEESVPLILQDFGQYRENWVEEPLYFASTHQ
ncbi:hypothetical protein ACE1CA_15525 [Aerosakkonemataceae cyanobacterium BLCC-F167]|uniref:Uncharacterized protein n=2 Tax=Floridanema TaxID=3396149 RepID=A0ABV4WLJ0_9CYAN